MERCWHEFGPTDTCKHCGYSMGYLLAKEEGISIKQQDQIAQLQARLESEEAHYARLVEQGRGRVDIADIPKLKEFLLAQEKNIAWGQEAYGELEPLFNAVFGRRPNDEG